jgi:hypothetical protein
MEEIDTSMTDELICPHCGYEFSDSWEFALNGATDGKVDCRDCNKEIEFEIVTEITFSSWVPEKETK